jgi:hypothetical protein
LQRIFLLKAPKLSAAGERHENLAAVGGDGMGVF